MAFPTEISNPDIVNLTDQLKRYAEELIRATSAGLNFFTPADLNRLESYVGRFRADLTVAAEVNLLDLPKTHPQNWPVEPMQEFPPTDNLAARAIERSMRTLHDELMMCDSNRLPTSLLDVDANRAKAVLARLEAQVAAAVEYAQNPLDMPESSPDEPLAGNRP